MLKNLFFFMALGCVASCATSSDKVYLQQIVGVLADDKMQGRLAGSVHEKNAADFLAKSFQQMGLTPASGHESFLQPFSVNGKNLVNVIACIKGSTAPEEIIVFSAHYDHIGIVEPVKGDSIANGADDNASGVAGMLWLAKQLVKAKPQRTLLFVAFSGEESGMLGSQYFASQLKNTEKIVFGLNFEMLGKVAAGGKSKFFITGYEQSDLGKKMQEYLKDSPCKLLPDPYSNFGLFYRSDNISLAKLGIPAHTLSSDPIDSDPHYHKPSDEPSTLVFENMEQVMKGILTAVRPLTDKSFYPTRIVLKK